MYANKKKLEILLCNLECVFDNANLFCLDGYKFRHKIRNNKKSGVVTFYINDRIQYQIIDNSSINIDNCLECITAKLLPKPNIIGSSIYRLPNSRIDYSTNSMDSMFKSKKRIVFMRGDVNINLLDYELNIHAKHFVNLLFHSYYFPCYTSIFGY